MTTLHPTTWLAPSTVDEAVEALAAHPGARPIAGGSDLMVQIRGEGLSVGQLVHLGRIPELRAIEIDEKITIGAGADHTSIQQHPDLRRLLPALTHACSTVGGVQTQNVGTLAGNVCNASPAADTIAPLLVAETVVVTRSRAGGRRIPIGDFVLGRRQVDLLPGEMVTGFEIPIPPPQTVEAYSKVGPRSGMEVALVGLAARLRMVEGRISEARIALAAVGPRAFRATEAESILVGTTGDPATLSRAGEAAAAVASPIDDFRATASYRRRIIPGLLARTVATLLGDTA